MLPKLAARDLVLVAVAGLLWWALAAFSAGEGWRADLAGLTAGLPLGLVAYVAHEWGHLAGAVASGSRVRFASRLGSPFVFSFDSRRNSRRQFLVMSSGGFAMTALGVWAVYALLPDGLLASRVARGTVLFLALLGVVVELPLVFLALARRELPPVETFPAHRRERAAA